MHSLPFSSLCLPSRYFSPNGLHFISVLTLGKIMDPKMDSGAPGAEEILDGDYDLNRTLKPEEVIGIIDQLLCHEVVDLSPLD